MNQRDAQIAGIRKRNRRLDQDRLGVCYDKIKDAYEAASVIPHLAQVIEEHDRTPSDFRVLSQTEARHLWQFNDNSYHWDNYCHQLGSSVAHAEKRYVFEELQRVPPTDRPINADNPQFDGILNATRQLIAAGYNPDVLCAPNSLFEAFIENSSLAIDWYSSPSELLVAPGGPSLKMFWSSGLAPLDMLIVFESRKTLWRVKLDPVTDQRLTMMIGEPDAPPDAVSFLAETVAKYEILDPAAIRSILIEGVIRAT